MSKLYLETISPFSPAKMFSPTLVPQLPQQKHNKQMINIFPTCRRRRQLGGEEDCWWHRVWHTTIKFPLVSGKGPTIPPPPPNLPLPHPPASLVPFCVWRGHSYLKDDYIRWTKKVKIFIFFDVTATSGESTSWDMMNSSWDPVPNLPLKSQDTPKANSLDQNT